MKENFRDERIDSLFKAILTLKNVDECYDFFEDLCTVAEIREMSRRLHAAVMLTEGKTYAQIASDTGVSTATISRVKRSLRYGNNGYKEAIATLASKERK